jgi:hypothetical protein
MIHFNYLLAFLPKLLVSLSVYKTGECDNCDVLVEELAEHAALCLLVCHTRTAGGASIGASLLFVKAGEGWHET